MPLPTPSERLHHELPGVFAGQRERQQHSSIVAGEIIKPASVGGGHDQAVRELNRQALDQLTAIEQLVVVPRATHLFEEPGALEEVPRLARAWFIQHLTSAAGKAKRLTAASS